MTTRSNDLHAIDAGPPEKAAAPAERWRVDPERSRVAFRVPWVRHPPASAAQLGGGAPGGPGGAAHPAAPELAVRQRRERGLETELRRLRRAALFFAGCVVVFVALSVLGIYH